MYALLAHLVCCSWLGIRKLSKAFNQTRHRSAQFAWLVCCIICRTVFPPDHAISSTVVSSRASGGTPVDLVVWWWHYFFALTPPSASSKSSKGEFENDSRTQRCVRAAYRKTWQTKASNWPKPLYQVDYMLAELLICPPPQLLSAARLSLGRVLLTFV